MSNASLNNAKVAKNDEFYTRLGDIEKEVAHYRRHFRGMVVYSNCDGDRSQFVHYFRREAGSLLLDSYMHSDGDFRFGKSWDMLSRADIVVTNPPFSLFRRFMDALIHHGKKFLVVGNMNALKNKTLWGHLMDGKVWLGCNHVNEFMTPDGGVQRFGNIVWFTNMDHDRRLESIACPARYHPSAYPEYDNIRAIDVGRVCDIPADYDGVMGVPISFMERWNPDQFEIVGLDKDVKWGRCADLAKPGWGHARGLTLLRGESKYARILIRHRQKDGAQRRKGDSVVRQSTLAGI